MVSIEKYQAHREVAKELHRKMMKECLNEAPFKIGRLLGIVREKTFILESMNEMNAITDMALHEYRVNNKNAVEAYRERVGWDSEVEKEILDALLASYVSLFRVVGVNRSDRTLSLSDLLSQRRDVVLTDIRLSETVSVGYLLFLRIVPFRDFNMNSGITFVFPGDTQGSLLTRYKKLSKKLPSASESIKRFASFFWLNRKDGLEVMYE